MLGFFWAAPIIAQERSGAPVVVAEVREQEIYRVLQLTGTVTSARSARLSAATSGLVTALHVDAGSRVEQGQVLLELDPELAQLQAQGASAAVEQARTALTDARRRLDEARSLAPQRSIAESVVRDLAAELAQDEAALHEAEAEAGYQLGILARHTLKAPFSGVISTKLTELGEWVNPGQPVLELVAIDDVRLDFPVAEDYLEDIQVGAPLTFGVNSDPSTTYAGTVATVVPVTDPGARTFLLRVLANNPGQRLIPGMSVRASLKLATGRRALVVPRDGVVRYPDGRVVVWTVEAGADGLTVRENVVRAGLTFDSLVEVLEGLAAGAKIVVRGNEALQNGQRVIIR
jgi:RND family efflux transporter MFP subunit